MILLTIAVIAIVSAEQESSVPFLPRIIEFLGYEPLKFGEKAD